MNNKIKKPLKNKRAVSNTKKKPLSTSVKAKKPPSTSVKPQKPIATSTKTKKPPPSKGAVSNVNKKPLTASDKPKKQTSKRPVSVNIKKPSSNSSTPKKQRETNKHIPASYPHFRYFKKNKHPALILGEQPIEEYRYRKVMHGIKDGDRSNEKVTPNPKANDTEPMYIGKRVRHDKKVNFEYEPLPWQLPKESKKK